MTASPRVRRRYFGNDNQRPPSEAIRAVHASTTTADCQRRFLGDLRSVGSLQNPPSPGSIPGIKQDDLAHQLFNALAQVKIFTSQVAMHLDTEWRHKLFRQLDSLHDIAEWEPGDEPIQRELFVTFLRAILSIRPKRCPGLGLSQAGHLVAAWTTTNDDRLTIVFLAHDRVRWVLSRHKGQVPERFAGETKVRRIGCQLSTIQPRSLVLRCSRSMTRCPMKTGLRAASPGQDFARIQRTTS